MSPLFVGVVYRSRASGIGSPSRGPAQWPLHEQRPARDPESRIGDSATLAGGSATRNPRTPKVEIASTTTNVQPQTAVTPTSSNV